MTTVLRRPHVAPSIPRTWLRVMHGRGRFSWAFRALLLLFGLPDAVLAKNSLDLVLRAAPWESWLLAAGWPAATILCGYTAGVLLSTTPTRSRGVVHALAAACLVVCTALAGSLVLLRLHVPAAPALLGGATQALTDASVEAASTRSHVAAVCLVVLFMATTLTAVIDGFRSERGPIVWLRRSRSELGRVQRQQRRVLGRIEREKGRCELGRQHLTGVTDQLELVQDIIVARAARTRQLGLLELARRLGDPRDTGLVRTPVGGRR